METWSHGYGRKHFALSLGFWRIKRTFTFCHPGRRRNNDHLFSPRRETLSNGMYWFWCHIMLRDSAQSSGNPVCEPPHCQGHQLSELYIHGEQESKGGESVIVWAAGRALPIHSHKALVQADKSGKTLPLPAFLKPEMAAVNIRTSELSLTHRSYYRAGGGSRPCQGNQQFHSTGNETEWPRLHPLTTNVLSIMK